MASAAPVTRDELLFRLAALQAEIQRRKWLWEPESWAIERLKRVLWSKQLEILRSIRDNRKTAVMSCHQAGKSFLASVAVAWWIDVHKPGEAFVVTSAPTGRQVKTILWREINRRHAEGQLAGHTNQTEWYIPTRLKPQGEKVAFGQKPSDKNPTAFQGIHSTYVLVVFDESCGMPQELSDAADTLMANEHGRRLDIGNPDDVDSTFYDNCQPNSGYNVIRISAFDTPNFTGEQVPGELRPLLVSKLWVEERRKAWAKNWIWTKDGKRVIPPLGTKDTDTDPMWQSKVLGRFPAVSGILSLIPEAWIEAAQERELVPSKESVLGVDVGAGGDASTATHRRGKVARIVHSDHNPNTMQTCGNIVALRHTLGATVVKVDKIGIGAGLVDRGMELNEPFLGVNVGDKPRCVLCGELGNKAPTHECDIERFENLRAQLWWTVREAFEEGDIDIDPDDHELAEELKSLRFFRTSRGRIQIESKKDALKRGVKSPNKADSLMLSYAEAPVEEKHVQGKAELVW